MTRDDDFSDRPERPRKAHFRPKKNQHEILASLRANDDRDTAAAQGFAAQVHVTNTERAWIGQHLLPFHRQRLIDDVLLRVKAGKEATVYLCSGHPDTGRARLVAKLYRERATRGLQNAGQYEQGRGLLTGEGQVLDPRAWRLHKAVAQKSRKGRALTQGSWLLHEYSVLRALHAAGADVPEPIEYNEQALLLEFIGEGNDPAPILQDVTLDPKEAPALFERTLRNVEQLLRLGWVHGDLSAYNILYQPGRITLIDFPQVASIQSNPSARALLRRDLEKLVQYFSRFCVTPDAAQLTQRLWRTIPKQG
ncbi:MAG: RIO1 family regulatory kinase/ATPase [Deltaproteobacteria bacterium]